MAQRIGSGTVDMLHGLFLDRYMAEAADLHNAAAAAAAADQCCSIACVDGAAPDITR